MNVMQGAKGKRPGADIASAFRSSLGLGSAAGRGPVAALCIDFIRLEVGLGFGGGRGALVRLAPGRTRAFYAKERAANIITRDCYIV